MTQNERSCLSIALLDQHHYVKQSLIVKSISILNLSDNNDMATLIFKIIVKHPYIYLP